MKLTEAQLEEAREYLRTGNMDALGKWFDTNKICMDRKTTLKYMGQISIRTFPTQENIHENSSRRR